ncbi:MAG: hypothetical protein JO244_04030 [Solirubrobacterales bacterium]|nr:hypothetical protein [Solirubrobacterales bacterium]
MSNAQVAVLGMRGQVVPDRRSAASRPQTVRLVAFGVLGVYAAARWSSLLTGGTHGRLIGILGLALMLAAGRPVIAVRSRLLAALFTALILVAAFPVAGVPLHWVLHFRLAVMANAIGQGLSGLPQALIPYTGFDPWVRLDIVLGGAVLLFDAALLLAFAPREMDDLRRAGAALPLVALIAVPSTLEHPKYPYLDGLVLFLFLAGFLFADRVSSSRATSALGICFLAGVAAMLVAPALAPRKPWLNYEALANSLAPKALETFNWSQNYGPIDWPRRGRTVLEIKAAHPEYWKAEDLDVFDGRAWTQGIVPGQVPAPAVSSLATWSQTIQVTVRGMKTSDIIGAGLSSAPAHVSQPVVPGFSPGTWVTGSELQSGESYSVRVYTPQPTPAQLNSEGSGYAGLPPGYRTVLLPPGTPPGFTTAAQIVFPVFHSGAAIQNVVGIPVVPGNALLDASVYAGVYRLAQRLARASATPYAFVLAVERLLSHGYTYDENPPVSRYPLEGFLFSSKRGYCQQFAGAMALLLRMGGVPARVAVGFTDGHQDLATGKWLVSDLDAHAWVEVWFPRFGWVRFDPTPSADPALAGIPATAGGLAGLGGSSAVRASKRPDRAAALGSHATGAGRGRGSSGLGVKEVAPALALVLALVALALMATRPLDSVPALVSELERGMARSGRPLSPDATLVQLEARLGESSQAAEYARSLRLVRFAGADTLPSPAQRRALRRELALGLGPLGWLRAWWALPPRRRRRLGRHERGDHAAVPPEA